MRILCFVFGHFFRNYETEILKQQIAMLKATIIREEEKASELEFKSRIFSDGEVNSQKQVRPITEL